MTRRDGQLSVTDDAVVSCGVTFWLMLMFGLIVPQAMIFPVPALDMPIDQCVAVAVLVLVH